MTTRIYKTEKFIPANGGNPVYQIQEEATVGSQVIRLDPRNPTPEELQDADEAFAAAQQATINTLTTEKDTLTTEKATLEDEKSALENEKSALESQLAASTEQVESLTIEKDELTEQLAAANARIAALLQEIPFNPRIIDATAFYDRLTKDEILTLFTSSDATTKQIGETILAYKTNDWPVVFESTEFQQMMGYLLQSGTLTESRMAELTRDATRDEAYQAD